MTHAEAEFFNKIDCALLKVNPDLAKDGFTISICETNDPNLKFALCDAVDLVAIIKNDDVTIANLSDTGDYENLLRLRSKAIAELDGLIETVGTVFNNVKLEETSTAITDGILDIHIRLKQMTAMCKGKP